MSFPIFENRMPKNYDRLNNIGKRIYNFFLFWTQERKPYYNLIESITVTSLQRQGSPSHSVNKAIDIVIKPLYLNLFFFNVIHRYMDDNIYLSSHNTHLHIDELQTRNGNPYYNKKRVEYIEKYLWRGIVEKTRYVAIEPNIEQFNNVPINYRNEYNNPLFTIYRIPLDYQNAWNSITWRFTMVYSSDPVMRILHFVKNNFERIIPQGSKYELPDEWRSSIRGEGGITPAPAPTPVKFSKWIKVGIAIAGVYLFGSILSKPETNIIIKKDE